MLPPHTHTHTTATTSIALLSLPLSSLIRFFLSLTLSVRHHSFPPNPLAPPSSSSSPSPRPTPSLASPRGSDVLSSYKQAKLAAGRRAGSTAAWAHRQCQTFCHVARFHRGQLKQPVGHSTDRHIYTHYTHKHTHTLPLTLYIVHKQKEKILHASEGTLHTYVEHSTQFVKLPRIFT